MAAVDHSQSQSSSYLETQIIIKQRSAGWGGNAAYEGDRWKRRVGHSEEAARTQEQRREQAGDVVSVRISQLELTLPLKTLQRNSLLIEGSSWLLVHQIPPDDPLPKVT